MRRSMTDREFHERADALLDRLEGLADAWLQDDVIDIDTQRAGSLLEMSFPNGSKLVINKQPPLQEIWLASREGGYHFRWDGAAWLDTKSAENFSAVFAEQASRQGGQPLQL
jgi:CyaY protein